MVNIAAIVKIMVNGSLTTSSSIDKKVCTSLTSAEIQAITSPFLSLRKKAKGSSNVFYTWHCACPLKYHFVKVIKNIAG
jgi:hypothetical protein